MFRPYPKMKDSGVEWLGQIPECWNVDRLKWSTTGCFNGIWGDEPNGGDDDIVCVRVADFIRTKFLVVDDPPTRRAVDKGQREHRVLRKGDLLIEKSGGGDLQLVGCVVYFDREYQAVCSNFVARMPIAADMHPRFWSYVHAALYAGRLNYPSIKQTTGIQNLDAAAYLNEKVVFPPVEEQEVIASFLDHKAALIDDLSAKRERQIELLQEQRTAIISRAVTKGLNPNVPMKDSGVQWLGDIPRHWHFLPLRRLLTSIDQGWSPVAEDRPVSEGEWGVIKLNAVDKGVFRPTAHKALPQDASPDSRYEIREGDFLLTRANTPNLVGDVCVVGTTQPRLMLSDLVYRLQLQGKRINPNFLCFWLLSTPGRHQIIADARGSSLSMVKVAQGHIQSWCAVVPPMPEQHSIVMFLNCETTKIDIFVTKVQQSIEKLREYRLSLISAAVTGKIDVREWTNRKHSEEETKEVCL